MKKVIAFIIAAITALTLFACGKNEPAAYKTRVISLKGPTGMGMVQLFENDGYDVTMLASPDEATADIVAGRFDVAAVPTNLAAVLYNKTGGKIRVLGVNTMGVLYMLENGNSIKSIKDLEGKKVGATGKGSTPEYILNYLLKENNVNCDVEYFTEHSELMTHLLQNRVQIAMIPEPNVSTAMAKNPNLRIAIDITKEWKNVSGVDVAQGCVIVSEEFAEKHTDELEKFKEDYKNSVVFVNNNHKTAAEKIAEKGIIPSKEIAEKAIPNSNICFLTGDGMQKMLNNFWQVLFDANPKSVGGKIPDEKIWV